MHDPKTFYRTVRPFLFGCLTGIICGVTVALFLVCTKIICAFAFGMYGQPKTPLLVVCIIMLALISCIIMSIIQTFCATSRGSGIPLAECCARGMLRIKWFRNLGALIAGSLISFTCGMPLGSEGPSIGIGGLIGDGVSKLAKTHKDELNRYLVTGGASAGLAVAFNAPLTGVAFALEETHRRFSPGILLAAFSAVVPAVAVAQLIFWGLSFDPYMYSLGVRFGTAILAELEPAAYSGAAVFFTVCGIAVGAGALSALAAIAFNHAVFGLGKLFKKIDKPLFRLLPAFLLAAICGLVLPRSAGTGEATLFSVTHDSATWLLIVLLAVRFVLSASASGAGVTGGLFLPMIAISGLIGRLISKLCVFCGMDAAYTGNIVIICIAAFFAASVRAPISAIVMALELTAHFTGILPIAVAVAVATALGGLTRTAPLYEHMMEELQRSATISPEAHDVTIACTVAEYSALCGKRIRDVMWPYNSLVVELVREDGTPIVPDGETVILAGDRLTVRAQSVVEHEFESQIQDYGIICVPIEKQQQ